MKNILELFGSESSKPSITKKTGILTKPGDRLEAYITKSGRNVLKVQKDNGNSKYSITQYPTGTIVETKVTKKK
ncbi:MAG: hypothetical protein ACI3XJ_11085 [Oscillospiraceae bacterium]